MRRLVVVLLFLSLVACAAEDQMMVRPPAAVPGGVNIPKSVPKIDPVKTGEIPPTLVVGTKFIYRQANVITKNWVAVVWTVSDRIEWQGQEAYKIDTGDRYQILDSNLNFLAAADREGKVISAAVPFIRIYTWPLRIGASHSTSYDYYVGGKKSTGNDPVSIDDMASVTVPAGQFSVFILKRTSATSMERIYYSPTIGFPVKWHISRTVDNANGPGETIVELVKVEKPN